MTATLICPPETWRKVFFFLQNVYHFFIAPLLHTLSWSHRSCFLPHSVQLPVSLYGKKVGNGKQVPRSLVRLEINVHFLNIHIRQLRRHRHEERTQFFLRMWPLISLLPLSHSTAAILKSHCSAGHTSVYYLTTEPRMFFSQYFRTQMPVWYLKLRSHCFVSLRLTNINEFSGLKWLERRLCVRCFPASTQWTKQIRP